MRTTTLSEIKGLSVCDSAPCPCSVPLNATKTLSVNVSSGTPPYTYNWSIVKPDGTIETPPSSATLEYIFDQEGNYSVSVSVTDSCPFGALTSNTDSCTVNVTPLPYVPTPTPTPIPVITPTPTPYPYVIPTPTPTPYPYVIPTPTPTPYPYVIPTPYPPAFTITPPPGIGCPNCDLTTNYCIAGTCIPKQHAIYGGIGFGALLLLTLLK